MGNKHSSTLDTRHHNHFDNMSQMTLMETNNDCLVEIFRHLCFEDLLSVSEVCKRFQQLSVITFKCVWKNKEITLRNWTTKEELDSIRILHQFGSLLQRVHIQFGDTGNEDFFNAIVDNCSLNLIEVRFSQHRSCWKIDKFLNKGNIFRFNEKFSNLRKLEFGYQAAHLVDQECIEQTFSSLEHLDVSFIEFKNLRNFIRLNPQMKSLPLTHSEDIPITRDLMEFIHDSLPELIELHLLIIGNDHANSDLQPVVLKNIKRLRIDAFSTNGLSFLSYISMEKVEDIKIEFLRWNDEEIDAICKFKEVEQLTLLSCIANVDGDSLRKLSTNLPKLSKLTLKVNDYPLDDKRLNINDVVHFVEESKQLTEFVLLNCYWNLNYISGRLDPAQWIVTRPQKALEIRKTTKLRINVH